MQEINTKTKDILLAIKHLKTQLEVTPLAPVAVARGCKAAAVLLRGFKESADLYNSQTKGSTVDEGEVQGAISAAQALVLFAQAACRKGSADAGETTLLTDALIVAVRRVTDKVNAANPRYSRWQGAPTPTPVKASSQYGGLPPQQGANLFRAKPAGGPKVPVRPPGRPSIIAAPAAAAPSSADPRVSDLFADIEADARVSLAPGTFHNPYKSKQAPVTSPSYGGIPQAPSVVSGAVSPPPSFDNGRVSDLFGEIEEEARRSGHPAPPVAVQARPVQAQPVAVQMTAVKVAAAPAPAPPAAAPAVATQSAAVSGADDLDALLADMDAVTTAPPAAPSTFSPSQAAAVSTTTRSSLDDLLAEMEEQGGAPAGGGGGGGGNGEDELDALLADLV